MFWTVVKGFADGPDGRGREESRTQEFGSKDLEQWSFHVLRLEDPKRSTLGKAKGWRDHLCVRLQ